MKEEELVENRLAIELSRGTILDEYLIKFLKSNGSNHFVEEIENSSKLIKELEEILFLLDLDVTDLMRIRDDLRRSLQKIEDNIFSLELPKQDIEKLMSDISQWRENDEKLLSDISSLRKKEEKLMFEEENKQKRLNVEKKKRKIESDFRRIISKALDTITEYQNNIIIETDNIVEIINEKYSNTGKNKRNQVFLSHAFEDRLYTLGLFLYFYNQNVYLYIDWMHQSENSKTKKLKYNLTQEIRNSNQLLFLRTLNSELALHGGKRGIREWCAWEIGTFDYKTNGEEDSRFYINRFRQNRQSKSKSQLIQDFKPLRGISNGSLY